MLTVNTDAARLDALEDRVAALETMLIGKPSSPSSNEGKDRAAYMRDYMRRRRGKRA